MSQKLTLAVSQSHTLSTVTETLRALSATTRRAAFLSASLILFPEAYLGGYPRGASFGATVGGRKDFGREQFKNYFQGAVDLGDTPGAGAGDDWVEKKLPVNKNGVRGDGTREELERVAKETGVFLVTGVVERSGGSLYCSVVYVDPERGCLGKRRKVMPTGSERLIWAQGSPSTLKAVTTEIKGVKITLASAICWENYMPLLRYSLYSQNVNLYLAPTADFRETWLPLMRTVAFEGRTVVLSANQCLKKKSQPEWIRSERKEGVAKFNGIQGLHGINGEYIKKRTSSTTKTHDSHEAAGPSPKWRALEPKTNGASGSSAVIEAEIDEPELPPGLTRNRRKSTITKTEDNHEICWPACKDKDSKPETIDVTSDAIPGSSPLRQSMTAPVDENVVEDDGNENGSVLTENRPRRASLVTRTEDNHEISWPPCGEKKRASRDAAVSKGTPIDKTTIEEANGEDDANSEDDANNEDDANEFVSRGGSCIISPMGEVLAGPLWDVDEGGLLVTEVDFDDCERGKLDLDVAGHYSRSDAFKLTVEGLDLNPPP